MRSTYSFADVFFQKLLTTNDELDFQKEFVDHLNFNKRYIYKGSLTTPPYSEALLWNVLAEPVGLHADIIQLFENHLKLGDTNPRVSLQNRSLQPLNGRDVFKVDIAEPIPNLTQDLAKTLKLL